MENLNYKKEYALVHDALETECESQCMIRQAALELNQKQLG
jgi:hypothetical protein